MVTPAGSIRRLAHDAPQESAAADSVQIARAHASPSNESVPAVAPPEDTYVSLPALTDDAEEEIPTLVAKFDVAAYARETAASSDGDEEAPNTHPSPSVPPDSDVRPSSPTLTNEVGPLPNEPEEDTLLRTLGGSKRLLGLRVPRWAITEYTLDPQHGYLLGLLDGATTIADVLDICSMPRLLTLRVIEELVLLGVVG